MCLLVLRLKRTSNEERISGKDHLVLAVFHEPAYAVLSMAWGM